MVRLWLWTDLAVVATLIIEREDVDRVMLQLHLVPAMVRRLYCFHHGHSSLILQIEIIIQGISTVHQSTRLQRLQSGNEGLVQ